MLVSFVNLTDNWVLDTPRSLLVRLGIYTESLTAVEEPATIISGSKEREERRLWQALGSPTESESAL